MRDDRLVKILASYNVLSVAASILLLRTNPIREYELSPYPPWLFLLLGSALVAVTIAIIIAPNSPVRWLLPSIPLTVIAIPVFRGYYYFGEGDPMYHLGAVQSLLGGGLPAGVKFYPLMHHLAASISLVSGLPPRSAVLFLVAVVFLSWVVALALLTRAAFGSSLHLGIIAASALLPITPVSTFPRPHTATVAIFFAPMVLLPAFLPEISKGQRVAIFAPLFFALILFHPMISLVAVLALVAWTDWEIGDAPSHLRPAILLASGLAVVAWLIRFSQFESSLASAVVRLFQGSAGADTASRASSLQVLGVSLTEYAVRAGSKYMPFALLSAFAAAVATYRKRSDVLLFTLAGVPVMLAIVFFLATGSIGIWTRFFGFLMLIGTVLAVVGVEEMGEFIRPRSRRLARAIPVLLLVVTVAIAIPTLLPSPYTLQSNDQVLTSSFNGFETGFRYADDSTPWYAIRSSPHRYHFAIYGPETPPKVQFPEGRLAYAQVPDHFNNQRLGEMGPLYLAVTSADFKRDGQLYRGFRYNSSDFEYLQSTNCIERVIDTGGFILYRVC